MDGLKRYPVIRNGKRIGAFPSLAEAKAACIALAYEVPGADFSWGEGSVRTSTARLSESAARRLIEAVDANA